MMQSLSDLALALTMLGALLVGGIQWHGAVRANDTKLTEVDSCASAVDPANGDEYRAAWNACWEAHNGSR